LTRGSGINTPNPQHCNFQFPTEEYVQFADNNTHPELDDVLVLELAQYFNLSHSRDGETLFFVLEPDFLKRQQLCIAFKKRRKYLVIYNLGQSTTVCSRYQFELLYF
jgi:hypothetical protein